MKRRGRIAKSSDDPATAPPRAWGEQAEAALSAEPGAAIEAPTQLPRGTVTFLFTDIESSTPMWEEQPTAMRSALERHDALLHEAVAGHSGHVVKTTGDGMLAVFVTVGDAIGAVVANQRSLGNETWLSFSL